MTIRPQLDIKSTTKTRLRLSPLYPQAHNSPVVALVNARHDLSLLKEQLDEELESCGGATASCVQAHCWRHHMEEQVWDAINRTEELEETK